MLTAPQLEVLRLIEARIRLSGVAPTMEEMRVAIGRKSKCYVHRIVHQLVERGHLRQLPRRARAYEVVRPGLRGQLDRVMKAARAVTVTLGAGDWYDRLTPRIRVEALAAILDDVERELRGDVSDDNPGRSSRPTSGP